jgi:hypothetical protein
MVKHNILAAVDDGYYDLGNDADAAEASSSAGVVAPGTGARITKAPSAKHTDV